MVSFLDLVQPAATGNPYIDALIPDLAYTPGYEIMFALEAGPNDNGLYGGLTWTRDGARDAFINATEAWSAVANISFKIYPFAFKEGDEPNELIDWVERLGDVDGEAGVLGYHAVPASGVMEGEFNDTVSLFTEANNRVGGYSFVTFLHEIGHGLGLYHPHDGPAVFPGVDGPDDAGDLNLNQGIYSVMSYVDGVGRELSPSDAYGWWATPMAFDIAAIQYLYGPNLTTATGNDNYTLPTTNAPGTFWACIWDVSGSDTISAAESSMGCVIDLREASISRWEGGGGFTSSVYGVFGGFTIANGVVIENATGGAGADQITGNSAANLLLGAGGEDYIRGGDGNDSLAGGDGADELLGEDGDDRIDGGAGADTMIGSYGSDTYIVDDAGDVIIDDILQKDTAETAVISYTLPYGVENLLLTGSAGINGTGNAQDNLLTGNGASNTLEGSLGDDVLDGRAGADTMRGGAHDDLYLVDDAEDQVVETAERGIDTVQSSVSVTLSANVENLLLIGTAPIGGTGNDLANRLTGNSAANRLDGGIGNDVIDGAAGGDTMTGGAGDDRFIVDASGDKVIEAAQGGTDTIQSTVTVTLAVNVERLVLAGVSAIGGTGNALANQLVGNEAANLLDGGAGADTMTGGGGNDTFVVDNIGDKIIETAVGGSADTVRSSMSYTLGSYVERLVLTGSAALNGTGNALANNLTGNAGANRLNGGSGADTMGGGGGNDIYSVDNAGDKVVETSVGDGLDTVRSTASFTLGNYVENLVLAGTAAVNGAGNALANSLTGNAAANSLAGNGGNDLIDGGAGGDTMAGGYGNDVYVVDNAGDKVVEQSGAGTDAVRSSVSHALADHVEKLVLTGTSALSGTGNGLANTIIGNAGANLLAGGRGNDVVEGGLGNDRISGGTGADELKGGSGADHFLFDAPLGSANVDKILDFNATSDSIFLSREVFAAAGANGTLASSAFHKGTAAADAADRIVYDQAAGKIFYDADGSGAGAAVLFATVTPGIAMSYADFIVYG
ncbi:MAG TPA: M10 family metallopeptidase [Allosphingosinicella sp.]|jgi:Ca2+-binding RTX toxin-like protein